MPNYVEQSTHCRQNCCAGWSPKSGPRTIYRLESLT
jgi:hypothetical protein